MDVRTLAALVSSALLSSCASTSEVAPLLAGEHQIARLSLQTGSTSLKPPAWELDEDTTLPTLTVRTRFLALEPELAERILGERAGGLVSLVSTREETDAALGQLVAEGRLPGGAEAPEIHRAMLTVREGQPSYVTVVAQEAYVESFELVVSAENAVADPHVGVLNDGLMVVVSAESDQESGKSALDLELTLTEYERPFAIREIELVASAPVQIQVPQGLVRRLTTSANLGTEDVLVVGGSSLPVGGGKVLVAFVAVEPVE